MSVASSFVTLLSACDTFTDLLPDDAEAGDYIFNTESNDVDPPLALYRVTPNSNLVGTGDGSAYLTNGTVTLRLCVPSEEDETMTEGGLRVADIAQDLQLELITLSASGAYMLLRGVTFTEPQRTDETLVDGNGDTYWSVDFNIEWGLTE
jgi:hypothetical protein